MRIDFQATRSPCRWPHPSHSADAVPSAKNTAKPAGPVAPACRAYRERRADARLRVIAQCVQPVLASSAKMSPLSPPTNTRLPSTAGCDRAESDAGNPNAHFNFIARHHRRGDAAGGARRVARWCAPAPQPFQPPRGSSPSAPWAPPPCNAPTVGSGVGPRRGRRRNPDTARRSASVIAEP